MTRSPLRWVRSVSRSRAADQGPARPVPLVPCRRVPARLRRLTALENGRESDAGSAWPANSQCGKTAHRCGRHSRSFSGPGVDRREKSGKRRPRRPFVHKSFRRPSHPWKLNQLNDQAALRSNERTSWIVLEGYELSLECGKRIHTMVICAHTEYRARRRSVRGRPKKASPLLRAGKPQRGKHRRFVPLRDGTATRLSRRRRRAGLFEHAIGLRESRVEMSDGSRRAGRSCASRSQSWGLLVRPMPDGLFQRECQLTGNPDGDRLPVSRPGLEFPLLESSHRLLVEVRVE